MGASQLIPPTRANKNAQVFALHAHLEIILIRSGLSYRVPHHSEIRFTQIGRDSNDETIYGLQGEARGLPEDLKELVATAI